LTSISNPLLVSQSPIPNPMLKIILDIDSQPVPSKSCLTVKFQHTVLATIPLAWGVNIITMADSPVEDPRKKRDNAQVHWEENDKPKKALKASKLSNTTDPHETHDNDADDETRSWLRRSVKNHCFDNDHDDENDSSDTKNGSQRDSHIDNKEEDGKNVIILPSQSKCQATSVHHVMKPSLTVVEPKLPPQQHSKLSSPQKDRKPGFSERSSSMGEKVTVQQEQMVWDLESAMLQLVSLNTIPLEQAGVETATSYANCKLQTREIRSSSPVPVDSSTKLPPPLPSTDNAPPLSSLWLQEQREYLTPDKDTWISFRMAHSGDAATIANWYHKSEQQKSAAAELPRNSEGGDGDTYDDDDKPEIDIKPHLPTPNTISEKDDQGDTDEDSDNNDICETTASNSSVLEHWLAEGLGDEVTCPSVYGLLCFSHSEDDNKLESKVDNSRQTSTEKSQFIMNQSCHPMMIAVVLLTVAWTSNERHLRVEWMGLHPNLWSDDIARTTVEQRVWLRISALSVMTSCPVIAVDKQVFVNTGNNNNNNNMNKADGLSKEKDSKKAYSKQKIVPSAE
jgi:hypothetical protein